METEATKEAAISAGVKVEDAVIVVEAKVDVIAALEHMATKSENSVDDALIKIVAAAKDNLDWQGVAKELL